MARRDVRVDLKLDVLRSFTTQQPMTRLLHDKANAVLNAAVAIAPRDTGRYAGSFSIVWAETDRRVVRVQNDAPYALALEFGRKARRGRDGSGRFTAASGGTTGARPLGRAIEMAREA